MKYVFFEKFDLRSPTLQKEVVAVILEGFEGRGKKSKKNIATEMLHGLFAQYNFDMKLFCEQCSLNPKQINRFFSYLLYSLYYKEIDLLSFPNNPEWVEFTLLCFLAEVVEENTIHAILLSYTPKKQLKLMAYSFQHLREGVWVFIDILEKTWKLDAFLKQLLKGLRQKFYDPKQLDKLLDVLPSQLNLKDLIDRLEVHAALDIKEIQRALPLLVEAIMQSPMKGYEFIMGLQEQQETESRTKTRKNISAIQDGLEARFSQYRQENHSFEEYHSFFFLFGLRGQHLEFLEREMSLSEVINHLLIEFKTPAFIPQDQLNHSIFFVLSLLQNLFAYHRTPSNYLAGLNRLVFGVPTKGLNFDRLQWLPSILSGLNELVIYLQQKGIETSLSNYPIVILIKPLCRHLIEIKSLLTG